MNAPATLRAGLPAPSTGTGRLAFVDLLRGWAVIVMIETHLLNATLLEELREGDIFQILKFINGLVAPSFLFASGLAYAITTRRKVAEYLAFGRPLFRQVGRLLFILLLGYMLHIPKFSFRHLLSIAGPEAWASFFQADVLHCIAVSLLLLQLLLLLVRGERALYRVLAPLTAVVVLVTPLMWGVDFWEKVPGFLAAYLNGLHHSLFPLFPWSAFLFAGALAGFVYVEARDRGRAQQAVNRLALAGIAAVGLSFLLEPVAAALYPVYDYWRFSPSFFLLRLGIVLVLCAAMFWVESARGVSPRSAVTLMGRESLLVYVTHLTLIYGDLGSFKFARWAGRSFGYLEVAAGTLLLLGLMILLALVWDWLRKGPALRKRIVQAVLAATCLTIFWVAPA